MINPSLHPRPTCTVSHTKSTPTESTHEKEEVVHGTPCPPEFKARLIDALYSGRRQLLTSVTRLIGEIPPTMLLQPVTRGVEFQPVTRQLGRGISGMRVTGRGNSRWNLQR